MSLATLTIIVCAIAVISLDVWFALSKQETVSQSVWRLSVRHPVIPFAAGVLCGHLFWQR